MRKKLQLAGLALVAIAVVVGVLFAVLVHSEGGYGEYRFQFYMPKQLPTGVTIKQKRISYHYNSQTQKYNDPMIELNFRTVDWVYSASESSAHDLDMPVTTTLTNYDPASIGVTCEQRTTPGHQSYRLCHWTDYGRIGVYEIKFIKQGTFIWSRMPNESHLTITEHDLDSYVDSFSPASAAGFPILRSMGA